MRLGKIFLLTLSFFVVLWGCFAQAAEQPEEKRIAEINQQIDALEEMKRGYESLAIRHENQAERLQFDDHTYLETRRHLELADENRAKAAAVQREIDRLQEEKKRIQAGV